MVENSEPQSKPFSRRVCLEDFLDDDEKTTSHTNTNHKHKNYSHKEDIIIAKNQQEFGHRKRIKP